MDEETKSKDFFYKKNFRYAISALVISAVVFISYLVISDIREIIDYIIKFINKLIGALTPLIIAVVLSYFFNRPVMFFENILKGIKGRRVISIGILYIIIFGGIASIVNFIVPRIQQSLVQLIYADIPRYSIIINNNLKSSMDWLKKLNFSMDYSNIQDYVSKFSDVSSLVLDSIMIVAKGLTQGIFNFVLAMILAFYILQNKEKLINSIKELIYLYGGTKIKNSVMSEAKEIDSVLNGYISGMLIDAVIVSISVMTSLKIVGHNYFFLMGMMIGMLNIIPYFGSLIGCTIAFIIALFQGVPTALYTLIALIIVQQFDANVIQPRVVGNRVGLEPLWVITAVLVFGNYWGVLGMIIAVPFTALIKAVLKRIIDKKRTEVRKTKTSDEVV